MKKFMEPEIEVKHLGILDVITTSIEEGEDDTPIVPAP